MKSLDLKEFLRFLWFSYDFRKSARAGNLQNYCEKKHWVFDVFMFKCLQTHCVRYDFDINARGCTLWYFLQWIMAVDDRTSMLRGKNKKNVDFVLFFSQVGWEVPDGVAISRGEGGTWVCSYKE